MSVRGANAPYGRGDWDVAQAEVRGGSGSSGDIRLEGAELFNADDELRAIKLVQIQVRVLQDWEGYIEVGYRPTQFTDESLPAGGVGANEVNSWTEDNASMIWGTTVQQVLLEGDNVDNTSIAEATSPVFPDGAFMWRPDEAIEVNHSINSGQTTSTPHYYVAIFHKEV
jgi:hypothetical protein